MGRLATPYLPTNPGRPVEGGVLLKESKPFLGDYATRPYVVRIVVREGLHPFVVWVYFLDAPFDRAHGVYCETLGEALAAYATKCATWQVQL